jgi:dipeptidyl aminopeptidase/acylaminoacyl peptidase
MPQGARVEDYAERSALQWPEKLLTPLLLLHGTADEKIEAHHSVELAKKLEHLRRQHALELYDGGNHALVRHWDAVLARINSWLEAHAA